MPSSVLSLSEVPSDPWSQGGFESSGGSYGLTPRSLVLRRPVVGGPMMGPVPSGVLNQLNQLNGHLTDNVWTPSEVAASLIAKGDNPSVTSAEFRIQNEDFPALPGANSTLLDVHSHPSQPSMSGHGGSNADVLATDSRYHQERSSVVQGQQAKTGIQTHPGGRVTGIPAGMLNDQFGMAGLLTFLRAIENDPNIVALALGHDLTTLGLNLNAPEKNLYATFGGPWADQPCRTQEIDAKVPDEYLTNAAIREKLPNIKLNKLNDDVLFYLFYNCPGEVYQMAAACELYSRDWRFHKGEGVWLTRSQYGGVKEHTGTYETGTYNVFDPNQWRKIPKEMTLEYKQLEERPKLPAQLASSQGSTGAVTGGGGPTGS